MTDPIYDVDNLCLLFLLISLAIDLSFTDLFKKKQLDFDFIIIPTVFLFQIH